MKTNLLLTSLCLSALGVAAVPSEAEACGGTFCDTGPNAMPVDQTGENILFVMGEDYTEAHIQIQYDPDTEAERFAWVVPITEIPEFSVGSDQLFQNVLAGTVPSYGFTTQFDSCDPVGDDDDDDDDNGDGTGGAGDDDDDDGGPSVVYEETVGAFDVVVLQGGTSEELIEWLDTNGYQQDPNAEPIMAEYLAEDYLFAAFRLTTGAEVAEIHPVALRFPNEEACIPLRLTRIAASDDMEIRSFFLSDNRVVPETYRHVLVNPVKLDWPNLASNYKEVITLAVDAEGADGRAFVTEYAGASDIVSQNGLFSDQWDASAFEGLAAREVIDVLSSQGLVTCFEDGFGTGTGGGGDGTVCQYNHLLLRGLLQQWLPIPDGISEGEFYGCLECFEGLIDVDAWNAEEFATALQDRVITPGEHAQSMLNEWPYLTRMYTTISPHEMTADPFFHENPDLPEVDLTSSLATRRFLCNNDNVWTLPDGREVYVPLGEQWPDFEDEMPWVEEVAEIADVGAPLNLVDNTEQIDIVLEAHNCEFAWPTPGACGQDPDDDDDDGDDDDDDGPGGDDDDDDDDAGTDGGDEAGQDDDGSSGGCGCTSGDPAGGVIFGLVALGLFAGRRRRD